LSWDKLLSADIQLSVALFGDRQHTDMIHRLVKTVKDTEPVVWAKAQPMPLSTAMANGQTFRKPGACGMLELSTA
jgi:hypothetical protein